MVLLARLVTAHLHVSRENKTNAQHTADADITSSLRKSMLEKAHKSISKNSALLTKASQMGADVCCCPNPGQIPPQHAGMDRCDPFVIFSEAGVSAL